MDEIEKVLAEHLPMRGGTGCECGWSAGLSLNDTRSDAKQHMRHLAAALAPLIAAREAAALREAATKLHESPILKREELIMARWLRDLADRIEAGNG